MAVVVISTDKVKMKNFDKMYNILGYIKNNALRKVMAGCLVGCLCLTSCSLDIPLEDQYSDPDAVASVDNARSLLTSAYIAVPHNEFDLAVLGPDYCPTHLTGKDSDLKNLYNWQENTISNISQNIWLSYYNVISTCDVLQERFVYVQIKNDEEQQELDAIKAESLALEAMCYFNLLRLFAPAYDLNPEADGIILKNRIGVEFPKRSSLKDCVAFIRNLLQEAVRIENDADRNGWLSQNAVRYLLAEVELYAANYSDAAKYAEEVLSHADKSYFGAHAYAHIWEPNSCNERIFGFSVSVPQFVSLQYDAEEGDYFAMSPEVQFAESDYRKAFTLYPFTMNNQEVNLMGKYNKLNKEGKNTGYINVMRYAGAYFIAAEACSRMEGQRNKALRLVNEYLGYCGADLLNEDLKGDVLTASILHAKYIEFAGEGSAYFDCKRTHSKPLLRWNKFGKMATSKIETSDYRWTFPIPASEYKNNENVTQNAGWPMNR